MNVFKFAMAVCASAALMACGGGGGDDGPPATAQAQTTVSAYAGNWKAVS